MPPLVQPDREVVPAAPRQVFKNAATKKWEDRERPTTIKALVLRNGKHGAMGTGEVVLATRLGGREKLDLLSEDYARKASSAVRNPFRLQDCIKIADSQLNAYLDEIGSLQDPALFYVKIKNEAHARLPPFRRANGSDPLKNPSYVASVVSNKVHNTYMLASAWSLVRETLFELEQAGLENRSITSQLRINETIRSYFLVLHDLVNVLVDACQANFSVLTTSVPHFSEYFKQNDDIDEPEFSFDWASLKGVHKSFLDAIIVELCLPNSQVSKTILFEILHEAVEEVPREAKRFPQVLWDAVGDLAVVVQLQDILAGPLLGPDGQTLRRLARTMPEEYEQWIDAQLFSSRASQKFANFKDTIYPLEKARETDVLETMWRFINLNYVGVSGMDIDRLWGITEIQDQAPQWHAVYVPKFRDDPTAARAKGNGNKKRLAITNNDGSDSDSMPSLQTVSDTTDGEAIESSDSDSDLYSEYGSDYGDEESEWDSDDEEDIKVWIKEAMNIAMNIPEFTDVKAPIPEFDTLAEERKDNPFLKLLGALRGRMFSSNPTLRTATRDQPRRPYGDSNGHEAPPTKPGAKQPQPAAPKSQKAAVEEVEDKDVARSSIKKKKKPKKKRRASFAASESSDLPEKSPTVAQSTQVPPSPTSPTSSVPPSPSKTIHPTPTKGKKTSSSNTSVPVFSSTSTHRPFESSASLPLPVEQVAQSAHGYINSEGLGIQKSKVKSRPDYGNLAVASPKQGFFSKFGKKKEEPQESVAGAKHSWFSRLGKKTTVYMRQLVGADEGRVAPMKWEHFLKVMREMGFQYDPSTAGSSVRFDPPDPRDGPITFHKPHPDPTLTPHMLKDFGKRLKKRYGWTEADFFEKLES